MANLQVIRFQHILGGRVVMQGRILAERAGWMLVCAVLSCLLSRAALGQGEKLTVEQAVAAPYRADYNRARDQYRHPTGTLEFFGVRPDMHVAEIWPGPAGYYAEILAPYLREAGRYIAVVDSLTSDDPRVVARNQYLFSRFEDHPEIYGTPLRADMSGGDNQIAANESLDMVLIFRNLHNWVMGGSDAFMLNGIYWALKPGGRLGIVAHRLDGAPQQGDGISGGYMTEAFAIARVESAGFRLLAKSEVNANPRDNKDHPRGVWTLPPTLSLGETDKEKYLAIGESDRMTLLFERKESR